jgi:soluble lytic murein transglycosylase-like protein/predicted negative regulator of RcsB-dependent stress response
MRLSQKLQVFCLVSSLLAPAAGAGKDQGAFSSASGELRACLLDRSWSDVEERLLVLFQLDPVRYREDSYDYLLGRALEKQGKIEEALEAYGQIIAGNGILKDHALFHTAQLKAAAGDLPAAIGALEAVIGSEEKSLLKNEARFLLADCARKAGDAKKALAVLETVVGGGRRRADLEGALISIELGKNAAAYATLKRLLIRKTSDDVALKSVELVEKIERGFSAPPRLDAQQLSVRGSALYGNRQFERALSYFTEICLHHPGGSYGPSSFYWAGQCAYRLERYEEALKWYRKGSTRRQAGVWGDKCRYQVARVYERIGSKEKARKTLMTLLKVSPRGKVTDDAALKLLEMNLREGSFEEAEAMSALILARFPGRPNARTALFRLMTATMDRGDLERSAHYLRKLEGLKSSEAFNREVTYWKGKLLEAAGKLSEAAEAYRSLRREGSRDFYALRAGAALAALAPVLYAGSYNGAFEKGLRSFETRDYRAAVHDLGRVLSDFPGGQKNAEVEKMLRLCFVQLPEYREAALVDELQPEAFLARKPPPGVRSMLYLQRGVALANLFCYGEAAQEFSAGLNLNNADLSELYTLALYYRRGGEANRSILFGEKLGDRIPADYPYELLPTRLLSVIFPTHYADLVLSAGRDQDVDPALIFSVIREESRFRADARSPAGARGLMQLIPETADKVAASMGLKIPSYDDLYDPGLSIRLGARYLSGLIDRSQGAYVETVAAYNAGENNADRWKRRCGADDADCFVREIDFDETKNYVQKILFDYSVYQKLLASEPGLSRAGSEPRVRKAAGSD